MEVVNTVHMTTLATTVHDLDCPWKGLVMFDVGRGRECVVRGISCIDKCESSMASGVITVSMIIPDLKCWTRV
jgi:hypothetical protein